jgi:protein-S-isoprenylcysteine O-methyltransferase Ste14
LSGNDWLRNSRGEWYVIAQAALLLALLLAPILDARVNDQISWPGFVVGLGGLLCIAGLGFVVLGSVALGRRNLSPFPKPNDDAVLIEGRIYSVVRHPLYSGFTFFAFGWGLVWSSIAALIAALVLLMFFNIKAGREERWLAAKFDGYAAYQKRVKKFIPFIY